MGKQKVSESELVWEYFGRRPNGIFVEVGANHPTVRSQSWFLETQGWTGVLVEPNPHHCDLLRAQRPKSQVFQVAVGGGQEEEVSLHLAGIQLARHSRIRSESMAHDLGKMIRVKLMTLNRVMEESGLTKIDFLSIDVEGMEFEVMDAFSFEKYRPQLFSIEDFCEDFEKKRYLRRVGYKLIRRVGYNNWYVPAETPASALSVSSPRELVRLIRKDFLSVPFIKVQKAFRKPKQNHAAAAKNFS